MRRTVWIQDWLSSAATVVDTLTYAAPPYHFDLQRLQEVTICAATLFIQSLPCVFDSIPCVRASRITSVLQIKVIDVPLCFRRWSAAVALSCSNHQNLLKNILLLTIQQLKTIGGEGGIHIYAYNPFECAILEHDALKVTTIVTTFFNSIHFKGFS